MQCMRKRKYIIYIDEEALGYMQVNSEYILARIGYNIKNQKERVLQTR
jgi:hypothetical protein